MSRVKKFKEYRNSLQNNSEDVLLTQPIDINKDIEDERLYKDKPNTESLSTLSVSYDEIMDAANKIDEDNAKLNKEKRNINYKKWCIYSLVILGCLGLLGGIIAIGILLFVK